MTIRFLASISTLGLAAALAVGCSCATTEGTPDGGEGFDGAHPDGAATDGSSTVPDAVYPDGQRVDTGPLPGVDADIDAAGSGECTPALCEGHGYLCGNCLDDDGDGEIDAFDDGCLGPCDDSEDVYDLAIPGGDTATCMIDCYYDSDQGSGNDGCAYDSRCDPLGSGTDPGHAGRCGADPDGPGVGCPDTQTDTCHTNCGPLTPNGCDCFGCCEITPGSGDYVFLGSIPEPGHDACAPETLDDPASCRPCTPVADCLNECGHCELCFGRDTLPPDCLGVDAGVPPVDAALPDGGRPDAAPSDAGMPIMRCDPGLQPCGLPTDPPCPAGDFCLSGCCGFFG
jgi:hypothetical protein